MKIRLFIHFYLPVFLWMAIIFILSSRQSIKVSDNFWLDFAIFKMLHIVEYGILFIFLYRALINTVSHSRWQSLKLSFIISLFYAVLDEIHQLYVPTREGRVRDVAFDTIGITLGWFFLWRLLPNLPQRLKNWAKNWQLI